MAGGTYERELKRILHGDLDVIKKATRSCNERETESYLKISEQPFVVSRAAGSMGFDLIALRGDISFPIEVKSSKSKVLRFSKSVRNQDQAKWMINECDRAGLFPLYAYRLKSQRGDSWRIFALEVDGVKGRLKLMYNRIPKIEKSALGHHILRWEDGMPLHKFIDYLCR